MKYKRPSGPQRRFKQFKEGMHQATIDQVKLVETKNGAPMFQMRIVGPKGESGFHNFVFDTDYTEENMSYLLASIEDNGESVDELEFDYDQETAEFLKGKQVFIDVQEEIYEGKKRARILGFLTRETFEGDEFPEEDEEDWDDDYEDTY